MCKGEKAEFLIALIANDCQRLPMIAKDCQWLSTIAYDYSHYFISRNHGSELFLTNSRFFFKHHKNTVSLIAKDCQRSPRFAKDCFDCNQLFPPCQCAYDTRRATWRQQQEISTTFLLSKQTNEKTRVNTTKLWALSEANCGSWLPPENIQRNAAWKRLLCTLAKIFHGLCVTDS
jgi:hypothetical protein